MSNDIVGIEQRINEKLAKIETPAMAAEISVPEIDSHLQDAYADSFWLSCILLSFGLLVVCVVAYLIKLGKEPEALLRSFGTILIVIAAVFLIVAGYSEKQIAPVIGLLGTIAGYLLGKSSAKKET